MEKLFESYNCISEGFYKEGLYIVRVSHKITNNNITVLTVADAYRVSRLLDLEYIVTSWYTKENN